MDLKCNNSDIIYYVAEEVMKVIVLSSYEFSMRKTLQRIEELTKDKYIQTFVWHVFIYQHLLITFNTAAKKFYKIAMLKLGNHDYFVHEFF